MKGNLRSWLAILFEIMILIAHESSGWLELPQALTMWMSVIDADVCS